MPYKMSKYDCIVAGSSLVNSLSRFHIPYESIAVDKLTLFSDK